MVKTKINIGGHEIPVDDHGRASLTDIWRAAKATGGRRPGRYRDRVRARPFLADSNWLAIRGGHKPGTWASIDMARDYADYLGLTFKQEEEFSSDRETTWEEPESELAKSAAEIRRKHEEAMRRSEENIRRMQEEADARQAEQEAEDAREREGEEWKGEPEPPYFAPGTIHCGGNWGPDHLFFRLSDLAGCPIPRASVN